MFANDVMDDGLIFKIYKIFIQLNKKNQPNSPVKKKKKKVGRRPKLTFLQRRHTDCQQPHEICSTSLIIREIQIIMTMRYHFKPIRMAIIKNLQ